MAGILLLEHYAGYWSALYSFTPFDQWPKWKFIIPIPVCVSVCARAQKDPHPRVYLGCPSNSSLDKTSKILENGIAEREGMQRQKEVW